MARLRVLGNLFACWKISLQHALNKKKKTPQTLKINCPYENKCLVMSGPTWYTSDTSHMGVASVEAVEQVSGLHGVQHHNLGGGVGADAHPHPAGHLVLQHQLLVLVPSLLDRQIKILITCTTAQPQRTSALLLTLFSCSNWSRLLWEPRACLMSSGACAALPPQRLTPAAHHSWNTHGV